MTVKLKIYYNTTHEEGEQALVNCDNGEIYISGDYYHEKTSEKTKGFLKALKAFGIDFEVEKEEIDQNHEMFYKLHFYDGSNE